MVKYIDLSNMDVSETYLGVTFLCLAVPGCKENYTVLENIGDFPLEVLQTERGCP